MADHQLNAGELIELLETVPPETLIFDSMSNPVGAAFYGAPGLRWEVDGDRPDVPDLIVLLTPPTAPTEAPAG
jgi:hypothetical protein